MSLPPAPGGGRGQTARLARGVRVRVGEAGRERALAAGEDLRPLARELAAQAVEDRLRRQAEPRREQAEHDRVLRFLGSRRLAGERSDRHRHGFGGRHARERQAVRSDAAGAVVDDEGGPAHRQLGPEAQEVVPVQGHRDVQGSARVEHRVRRDAQAAGRLAAPDLRPEALGEDGVVADLGGGGDERLAGGDDAVSAGSRHADHEVTGHPSPVRASRRYFFSL